VVVFTVGVALGLLIMVDGYSPVPFADFWAQFPFIERSVRGDLGLGDLWAQHNEHRIALARIQFLVDYRFLDGTNVFLFASIAASCLLLAATFAVAVWLDTRDWLLALGMLATAGTATMSPAGIENLTWAFQVQFVQVFLFAALAVLAVVAAARSEATSRQAVLTAAAALAAIATTYSMANGFLVWPIVVALAIVLRLKVRLAGALALVGLATVCSFFWHYEFSTTGTLSVDLLKFVAVYLGSAVWGAGETAAAIVGAFGLLLFPVLCVLAWMERSNQTVVIPFAAGLAAFVVLTACQTAVGRLHLGTAQALASRYSIGSFAFWLALLAATLPLVRAWRGSASLAAPAALGGAALVALFIGYRTLPVDAFLPTAVFGKKAAVVAYRAGVEDVSGAVTGVEGGPEVTSALRWMEREQLGPWAPGGLVDDMRVTAPSGMTARSCLGAVEADEPVTGGRRLQGWIAAPEGEATSRSLVVLGADGREVGLGLAGAHRPDVEESGAVDSEWTGFVAYVRGEPAEPLDGLLLGEDRRTSVCRLVSR
jgi:hypothetical protein